MARPALIAAAAVATMMALPAKAELRADVAICAAMEGDLDRLECFDEASKAAGLDGPQPQPVATSGTGKWQISRDKNPIDDSERVVLRLEADEGRARFGSIVTFIARCQSNSTEAYINWHDYLGNDARSVYEDWKRVTVRIGSAPASEQRWGLSTDSKATFAPSWAGGLLKEMALSDVFIAQVTPYSESPVTAIFDTTGMAAALQPLMEVCGWSLD